MKKFAHLVKNHLIESDVDKFPAALAPYREELEGRSRSCEEGKAPAGGMHRARLHHRFRLERLQGHTVPSAATSCPRACWNPPASNSRCSPRPPRRNSASTTRTSPRPEPRKSSARTLPLRSRASPWPSSRKAAHGLKAAASSLPTPNLNSAWLTAS